jgi:hypothetical protein
MFVPITAMAKRSVPPAVAPLVESGVTYSAPHDDGRKGIIRATDAVSGKQLWEVTVFEVTMDPGLEADVQWVFIIGLRMEKGMLKAVDERRREWLIDPKTRKVSRVKR